MPVFPDHTLPEGTIFDGRYEIEALAGSGSFGHVYRAVQRSTGQTIAVKTMRMTSLDDADQLRERFLREMRLYRDLNHPNIVRLIDSGEASDDTLFIAFEWVPGFTLREVLTREHRLEQPEALRLMADVLDALSCAHERGVIHRDLKPENIMIAQTGVRRNARVVDFGLGGLVAGMRASELKRLTGTQEMMGTPAYAAPEQLTGEAAPRSDLYSWGLILLECLTGKPPIGGAAPHEVLRQQLDLDEAIEIPAELEDPELRRLLQTVTAKRIEKRNISIAALLRSIDRVRFGEDASAVPSNLGRGERRMVTIACCRTNVDPNGTSDLEEYEEELKGSQTDHAALVARHQGRALATEGERAYFVFGYPQAREDDARRAAQAMLEVAAQAGPSTQIGIHSGEVLIRDTESPAASLSALGGPASAIAGRLADGATSGNVLATQETAALLGNHFETKNQGLVSGIASLEVVRMRSPSSSRLHASASEGPLVGRVHQLGELKESWERAKEGRTTTILVSGNAGIGKSRLVRELRASLTDDVHWLEAGCVEESQATPLHPFVELLTTLDRPLESLDFGPDLDPAEVLSLLRCLLGDEHATKALEDLPPDLLKEQTLEALMCTLGALASEKPVVLVVEDLHWADTSTLDFIRLQIETTAQSDSSRPSDASRIYVILTARDALDQKRLTTTLALSSIPLVQLSRLKDSEVRSLASALLGESLPTATLRELVERVDGIPLFVEEMLRAARRDQERDDDQRLRLSIPPSLHVPLTARLDALSSGGRGTALIAAALGREFRYEVLNEVAGKDEPELRDDLAEMVNAGLIFRKRGMGAERYVFRHHLLRDAAYGTIVRSARKGLHHKIATTLEDQFEPLANTQPEMLAHHFDEAGEPGKVVEYSQTAADQALRRAAFEDAETHAQRGIRTLPSLSRTSERDSLELELLTTQSTVYLWTRGFASSEVESGFQRGLEICKRLGGDFPISTLKVVAGLHTYYLAVSDRAALAELLPQMNAMAESEEPVHRITGNVAVGITAFWTGELEKARRHLAAAVPIYGTPEFQSFARDYGYNGGLWAHGFLCNTLLTMGFTEQAEKLAEQMLQLSEEAEDLESKLIAASNAMNVALNRYDIDSVSKHAERLLADGRKHRLELFESVGLVGQCLTQLLQGQIDESMASIESALEILERTRTFSTFNSYHTTYATLHLATGRFDEGIELCGAAIERSQNLQVQFHQPELYRLQAEMWLARGGESRQAHQWFRQAIDIAHRHGSKSYELNAAVSLARLLAGQGQQKQAREALAPVFDWFTEGLDSPALLSARRTLDKLS